MNGSMENGAADAPLRQVKISVLRTMDYLEMLTKSRHRARDIREAFEAPNPKPTPPLREPDSGTL